MKDDTPFCLLCEYWHWPDSGCVVNALPRLISVEIEQGVQVLRYSNGTVIREPLHGQAVGQSPVAN
jgi:hypothetical protein